MQLAGRERGSRGVGRLDVAPDLVEVARRHSARMSERDDLHHNPRLREEVPGEWVLVGENVGVGGDAGSIHAAFMDSPSHRDNILEPRFTEIGTGVVRDEDGTLWVTQVFRQPATDSPDQASAERPTSPTTTPAPTTTAPATTAPPTTVPATTTTPPTTVPATTTTAPAILDRTGPSVAGTEVAGAAPVASIRAPAPTDVPVPVYVAVAMLALVVAFQAVAVRHLGLA